tara:strand:- start:344 stop:1204 length:861 start_codon:yes stop_codon:yes gene_type:complete
MFKNKLYLYLKLMRFNNPVGIFLLLCPPFWVIAYITEGSIYNIVSLIFLVGVITTRSIGCVLNDFFDKNFDVKVSRTKERPYAANLINKNEVLLIFILLSFLNISLLFFLNIKTIILAIIAIVLIITYPLTKRFFVAPQLFLGITFAISTLMAYTAVTNMYPSFIIWIFFFATVIWVTMFDTIYAMADKADDLEININSTAILFGKKDKIIIALLQIIFYLFLVFIGLFLGFGYCFYFFLVLATAVGVYNQKLIMNRKPDLCIKAFKNNQYIGFLIFLGIYGEYII